MGGDDGRDGCGAGRWVWRGWMEAVGLDGGGWMGWRVGGRRWMEGPGWGGGRRLGWRDGLGARAWMEEWRVLDGEEWRDGGG